MLAAFYRDMKSAADPVKAAFFPRFFKAGPGQYAEGDRFIGITVPAQRIIAKKYQDLSFADLKTLIHHPIHGYRLTALLILVRRFERGDEAMRKTVADFYLKNLEGVNNWDLVDSSAHQILGAFIEIGDRSVLLNLARSKSLWKERIAVVATYHFIRQGDFKDFFAVAELLMDHKHDLIHKALGWMLREVGKRDLAAEEKFLKKHLKKMPRTMLRYAIERFPEGKRLKYLKK